jgi:hypothetical protein
LAQTAFKRLEKQDTYLCFVDLKKAYDSLWREGLFRKMEQEGVSVKLVRVWYQGVSIKLTVNDVPSSSFETKVEVRQGDTLSLLLFNIFINGIVQKSEGRWRWWRVGGLTKLLFADDMALMTDREEELKKW